MWSTIVLDADFSDVLKTSLSSNPRYSTVLLLAGCSKSKLFRSTTMYRVLGGVFFLRDLQDIEYLLEKNMLSDIIALKCFSNPAHLCPFNAVVVDHNAYEEIVTQLNAGSIHKRLSLEVVIGSSTHIVGLSFAASSEDVENGSWSHIKSITEDFNVAQNCVMNESLWCEQLDDQVCLVYSSPQLERCHIWPLIVMPQIVQLKSYECLLTAVVSESVAQLRCRQLWRTALHSSRHKISFTIRSIIKNGLTLADAAQLGSAPALLADVLLTALFVQDVHWMREPHDENRLVCLGKEKRCLYITDESDWQARSTLCEHLLRCAGLRIFRCHICAVRAYSLRQMARHYLLRHCQQDEEEKSGNKGAVRRPRHFALLSNKKHLVRHCKSDKTTHRRSVVSRPGKYVTQQHVEFRSRQQPHDVTNKLTRSQSLAELRTRASSSCKKKSSCDAESIPNGAAHPAIGGPHLERRRRFSECAIAHKYVTTDDFQVALLSRRFNMNMESLDAPTKELHSSLKQTFKKCAVVDDDSAFCFGENVAEPCVKKKLCSLNIGQHAVFRTVADNRNLLKARKIIYLPKQIGSVCHPVDKEASEVKQRVANSGSIFKSRKIECSPKQMSSVCHPVAVDIESPEVKQMVVGDGNILKLQNIECSLKEMGSVCHPVDKESSSILVIPVGDDKNLLNFKQVDGLPKTFHCVENLLSLEKLQYSGDLEQFRRRHCSGSEKEFEVSKKAKSDFENAPLLNPLSDCVSRCSLTISMSCQRSKELVERKNKEDVNESQVRKLSKRPATGGIELHNEICNRAHAALLKESACTEVQFLEDKKDSSSSKSSRTLMVRSRPKTASRRLGMAQRQAACDGPTSYPPNHVNKNQQQQQQYHLQIPLSIVGAGCNTASFSGPKVSLKRKPLVHQRTQSDSVSECADAKVDLCCEALQVSAGTAHPPSKRCRQRQQIRSSRQLVRRARAAQILSAGIAMFNASSTIRVNTLSSSSDEDVQPFSRVVCNLRRKMRCSTRSQQHTADVNGSRSKSQAKKLCSKLSGHEADSEGSSAS